MEGQKDALTMQIEAAVKKQRDMESQVAERDKRLSQALTMKDALTEQLDAERRRSEVAAKQEAERDERLSQALTMKDALTEQLDAERRRSEVAAKQHERLSQALTMKDALTEQLDAERRRSEVAAKQEAERDERLSQALTMKDALTEQLDAERRRSEVAAKQEAERDAMVRSALPVKDALLMSLEGKGKASGALRIDSSGHRVGMSSALFAKEDKRDEEEDSAAELNKKLSSIQANIGGDALSLAFATEVERHSSPADGDFSQMVEHCPDAVFDAIDVSGDGYIVPSELFFFLRKLNKKFRAKGNLFSELKIFQQLDLDGEGRVSREQFMTRVRDATAIPGFKEVLDDFGRFVIEEREAKLKRELRKSVVTFKRRRRESVTKPAASVSSQQSEALKKVRAPTSPVSLTTPTPTTTKRATTTLNSTPSSEKSNQAIEEADVFASAAETRMETHPVSPSEPTIHASSISASTCSSTSASSSSGSPSILNTSSSNDVQQETDPSNEANGAVKGTFYDTDDDDFLREEEEEAMKRDENGGSGKAEEAVHRNGVGAATFIAEALEAKEFARVIEEAKVESKLAEQAAKVRQRAARKELTALTPLETRRKRVGGGFQNQVQDPLTGRWASSDQYYRRHAARMAELREILKNAPEDDTDDDEGDEVTTNASDVTALSPSKPKRTSMLLLVGSMFSRKSTTSASDGNQAAALSPLKQRKLADQARRKAQKEAEKEIAKEKRERAARIRQENKADLLQNKNKKKKKPKPKPKPKARSTKTPATNGLDNEDQMRRGTNL